jgi:hypothetical protein
MGVEWINGNVLRRIVLFMRKHKYYLLHPPLAPGRTCGISHDSVATT